MKLKVRAKARRAWWRYVRRYRFELCRRCGGPVGLVWHAPDSLWLEVQGGPNGIRCIPCFDRECHERGHFIRWEVRPL